MTVSCPDMNNFQESKNQGKQGIEDKTRNKRNKTLKPGRKKQMLFEEIPHVKMKNFNNFSIKFLKELGAIIIYCCFFVLLLKTLL